MEDIWDKFEPGSRDPDIALQPLVSIAISLKRIADAWGKSPEQVEAIQQLLRSE